MPEGDTIFRAAAGLRRAIGASRSPHSGRTVPRSRSRLGGRRSHRGAIDPYGKHLLVRLRTDGVSDLVLHSHLQIDGQWHVYRPGERWWRGPSHARVVIETADFVAPCFDAPTVELLTEAELPRHPWMRSLGPDAMADGFDEDAAPTRLRSLGATTIGVAINDQRTLAGVGNVYKSEVLFIRRLSPFAMVDALSDDELRGLIGELRVQLRANRTGAWPRTTRHTRAGARSTGSTTAPESRAANAGRRSRCGGRATQVGLRPPARRARRIDVDPHHEERRAGKAGDDRIHSVLRESGRDRALVQPVGVSTS